MRKKKVYGRVVVAENDDYQYGVLDLEDNVLVPFGKYGWISGFNLGLARVKTISEDLRIDPFTGKTEKPKWGIIDDTGQEVLPLVYDEIMEYSDRNVASKVFLNGVGKSFSYITRKFDSYYTCYDNNRDRYGTHYGKYAGSYAQEVAGLSDDVIDDAFEGDPDAYWNIE